MITSNQHEIEGEDSNKRVSALWLSYVVGFGIILPLVTLTVELIWAWCAQVFFDPIPDPFHVILVLMVPVANLVATLARCGHIRLGNGKILFFNGIAIGISLYYTIIFIPILPIAAIALIWLIGLLPLAPLLSLLAAILCRRALPKPKVNDFVDPSITSRLSRRVNLGNCGIIVGLLVIVVTELPVTITEIGMRMATSTDTEEQLRGVRLLRTYSDHDQLLAYCYGRRGRPTDMISFLFNQNRKSIRLEDAQIAYYRVTGNAFNDQDADTDHWRATRQNRDRLNFDLNQGGNIVGGRLQDVHLSSSTIDGSVDPEAALAYLEWTVEFNNRSTTLAEARAQISLPPGAVVSRVTLWIDGEEREAAFAGTEQVRKAYQQIVQRKRDPLLVTTAGADTVLVQLYPIPIGGVMKARIGITAPLVLTEGSQGVLRLPHFKQQNFHIAADFEHSVWIESEASMSNQPAHLIFDSAAQGASSLRGNLKDSALKSFSNTILVSRDSAIKQTHAIDHRHNPKQLITQQIVKRDEKLENLVIVIDGSKGLQPKVEQLSDVIAELPPNIGISIFIAGDDILRLTDRVLHGDTGHYQQLADQLRDYEFDGGVDNLLALEQAWTQAAQLPNAAVLWVHGSQPITMHSVESLRQNWRRRPDGPTIYDFPLYSSVNRIAEAFNDVSQFKAVPRIANLKHDLNYQLSIWSGQRAQLQAKRQAVAVDTPVLQSHQSSEHLIRLWANDRIKALLSGADAETNKRALNLAARYQLVTPVSGAVVLENAQQYAANNLQAVEQGTVPTIPEPETWLLLIATMAILTWVLHRRRQRQPATRWLA